MFRHLLFVLALAASAPVLASRPAPPLVALQLVDRDAAQALPEYRHRGQAWVAGTPGHRYAVRLTNTTGERVLVVLSVDGVNAVSGETAAPSQAGYVLGPWESAGIAGWRKSLDDIAQFVFTDLTDSYAARTGRPANVGVIGVAVFTEREPIWRKRDEIARQDASPAPSVDEREAGRAAGATANAARPASEPAPTAAQPIEKQRAFTKAEEHLGTGHGAREYSPIESTTFERASMYPAEQLSIWYDSYRNLVAQGIIERPIARRDPQPFPGGYVPDPPTR
jgi:hypothetical protein